MILGAAVGERQVRLGFPRRRDIILGPPGRLPESEKGVSFPRRRRAP